MTSCDRHGGKRRGAGRKPKWDPLFKLRLGQDCERLFREASKEALNQNKGKILNEETHLLFGHWAALEGFTGKNNISALDTGCAWGNKLTALRLEDKTIFSCDKLN